MKDWLLWVHAGVKTLNLEILHYRLEDYFKELYLVRAARLFYLIQPIRAVPLFSGFVVVVPVDLT